MNEEQETKWFHTALALNEDYFASQQSLCKDDLLVIVQSLVNQIGDSINKPGIYEIKLGITKVK
jgi:hypothetical protein